MSMMTQYRSEEEKQNAMVSHLDLSVRTHMALKYAEIMYINQIQRLSHDDLLRIWPLTPQQVSEIVDALVTWNRQAQVQAEREGSY